MTAAERNRRHRRLARAGFAALPTGWVPKAFAERAQAQVEAWREEVEAAEAQELPRGRPPKQQEDA